MSRFDVVALIRALGIEPLYQAGVEVYARCPSHNDTGKPNWSINTETGAHNCWSCRYGGSLERLIADAQGLMWPDGTPNLMAAKVWARRFRGDDLTVLDELVSSTAPSGKRKRERKRFTITEVDLALFVDPPQWALAARRLTLASALAYGARWDDKADGWILPIRDPWNHYLLGWQAKGQRDRSFRNHPVGVQKASTLFGLETFSGGCAVLVESPLDAIRLASAGILGGLATYGAAVSDKQISVLAGYASSVVIAMDNPRRDNAGKVATLELARRLIKLMPTRVFDYDATTAKDPGDMSDAQIHAGLAHARSALFPWEAVHS